MLTSVSEVANVAISDTITNIIFAFWDKLKLKYNKYMIPVPEHFVSYTAECYERFSRIKCLAKGQAIMPLKQIYVPLTLMHATDEKKSHLVTGYDASFFRSNRQLLIVDTAGMGKSTIAKRLFIDIIDKEAGIPIFIELRRLSSSHGILSEILNQVQSFTAEMKPDLLYSFIQEGEFVFILDGYDEISLADKDLITNSLQDFIRRSSKNSFIMTSRQEVALTSFSGFETYKIKPLSKKEAFTLLRNYDDEKNKEVSKLLINKLEETNDFEEFLGNPLLVSMLLTAFSFKNEIPRQKHIFYRTVFDAYFNRHDLTKGGAYQHEKHSGLVIESFHKVLRFIGILCLKSDRIEFTKDELMDKIENALKLCPEIKCSAGDFFSDILEVVPLFVQDGVYYRWAHKSLYEYFAAQNIYRDIPDKRKALLALSSNERIEKSYNLLDLYYEIDFSSFRNIVIKRLLEEFVNYIEKGSDLTPLSIRWRQCFFSCPEFFFVQIDPSNDSFVGKVARRLLHEKNYCGLSYDSDKKKENFLFRPFEQTGWEFLLRLLASKNYPIAIPRFNSNMDGADNINIVFKKNEVYCLTESSYSLFNNNVALDCIISMMESMGYYVEYSSAKKELESIKEDEFVADTFARELFS